MSLPNAPRRRWSAPRRSLAIAPLLATLLLAACGPAEVPWRGKPASEKERERKVLVGTNWNGEPFSLDDLQGRPVVVFFGYTYCPDVCPFTLAKLKGLLGQLGDRASEVEVVFASVDPHRDSVAKLARYVPNFNRDFYGIRLDTDQLDATIQSFDLVVKYGTPKDGAGTDTFYYVDHTGSLFLLDRSGVLRVKHPASFEADDLLADLEALLDEAA